MHMNDPTRAGAPTCPNCGATREPTAIPYQEAGDAFAVFTCASCGHQFESWTSQAATEEPRTGHTDGPT